MFQGHRPSTTTALIPLLGAVGLLRRRRDWLVVHLPDAHDRYQRHLIRALNQSGVSSGFEARLTGSATLNLLLAPLNLALARLGGARIVHLHYLFRYSLYWATGKSSRRVLRWWFGVWLLSVRMLGLRLVWTVHNVLPHNPIFDDDVLARRMLLRHADAVIALSEYGRRSIKERFGTDVTAVIPPGMTSLDNLPERRAARASLKLAPHSTTVVFVGRLVRYKGVDLLLEALAVPIPGMVVRIAGVCSDEVYASELAAAVRQAQAAGVDVSLEIRRLTEDEYAAELSAADFAIYPFRSITNSETVMCALSCGVPVLIPALDALADLPAGGVMTWDPHEGSLGIHAVLEKAARADGTQRDSMRSAALRWASTRSWSTVGDATRRVYERVLSEAAR